MTLNVARVDADLALPRLTTVTYDQTRQYHPFAHSIAEGEWSVQPPTASRPIGVVRQVIGAEGSIDFAVWRTTATGEEILFDETHPTLFHAVAWLRWRLGAHAQ